MNKVYFISDFFSDEVQGGAELVDAVLIEHLSEVGLEVLKIRSYETEKIKKTTPENAYYIVSNFTGMSEEAKEFLQSKKYSIYEHDHKYLLTRDPSPYRDFKAPNSSIVNRSFYTHAENVFCQSRKHKEVVEKNLGLTNIVNLGCSLWSEQEFSALEAALDSCPEKSKAAILESQNIIKGQAEAIRYSEENNIDYDLIKGTNFTQFVSRLSSYESLIFFPKVLESFSRLAVEARVLNCKLITNDLLGCTSEDWFSKKGKDLLIFLKEKKVEILKRFENLVENKKETSDKSITVILNSYRRPYNLEMQIKAIKEQTTKPVQIWLWVNDHEDNRGFDYSSLSIDRIFRNDYNWKFYGRFAAALLADTEYVAIFDDDTIPGNRWFENCFKTMKTTEGILGSAGVILNSNRYVDHVRCGWPSQNKESTRVDLVGHAWFFKREWLQYLWREKPTTWDNGEDIQFSYLAQKYGNIQTYCPPHPSEDKSLHGSILGNELGIDDKATSTNSSVSHDQFFSERDLCVTTAIEGGWNTVNRIKF